MCVCVGGGGGGTDEKQVFGSLKVTFCKHGHQV